MTLGGGIGVVQTPLPPPERVSPFRMPHAMTGGGVGPSVEPCPQLSLALLDELKKTGGDRERGECAGNETALCGRRRLSDEVRGRRGLIE